MIIDYTICYNLRTTNNEPSIVRYTLYQISSLISSRFKKNLRDSPLYAPAVAEAMLATEIIKNKLPSAKVIDLSTSII